MKILLTGQPGIGKSTVLDNFKRQFQGKKFGIIAKEIRDALNDRVGFAAVNFAGEEQVFAHKDAIQSEHVIGGKYHVSLDVIKNFVVGEIERALAETEALILIDEIGRMQSLSPEFLAIVGKIFAGDNNILATIVYDPEPWSIAFKENPGTLLVNVNEVNRDQLPELLLLLYQNASLIDSLDEEQKEKTYQLLKKYLLNNSFISAGKLVRKAIRYILENKVIQKSEHDFEVRGDNATHQVSSGESLECDCKLFRGIDEYAGQAGECSHIQAVLLYQTQTS